MIAWGKKVSDEFAARVINISAEIGIDPDWLMACMHFESAGTFSPSVRNKYSGATGLIQFMPKTAIRLGTTTDELAAMSAVDQLEYVRRYFLPYKGRLKSLEDLYMAILWPRAIGKPVDAGVPRSAHPTAYEQNKGLDLNRDGTITKAEACAKVILSLTRGREAENCGWRS